MKLCFVRFTLARVKDPRKHQANQFHVPRIEPEDMETVNTRLRADQVFSITAALASMSPPLVKTLVGVNGIGEFMVCETPEEVAAELESALLKNMGSDA
jgi:hypothetical protein